MKDLFERKYTKFVSYSSANYNKVNNLLKIRDPEELDITFFAPTSLKRGDIFEKKIKEALFHCDQFWLFWSKEAAKSKWVSKEIDWAFERWKELDQPHGFFNCFNLDGHKVRDDISSHFHIVTLASAFSLPRAYTRFLWLDKILGKFHEILAFVHPPSTQIVFDISRLPRSDTKFFGRREILDRLDAAWGSSRCIHNVNSFNRRDGQDGDSLGVESSISTKKVSWGRAGL